MPKLTAPGAANNFKTGQACGNPGRLMGWSCAHAFIFHTLDPSDPDTYVYLTLSGKRCPRCWLVELRVLLAAQTPLSLAAS
jgi:hypothetical protein